MKMIGRFLASTAVASVLFAGAAMAQMAPPPNNAPNDQPARIQTQNPGPRDTANPARSPSTTSSDQQKRDQIGQAGGGTTPRDNSSTMMNRGSTDNGSMSNSTSTGSKDDRSMSQRAGDSMRNAGRKVKNTFSSDKSSSDHSSGRMNKQSAEGHKMDNIADQLNACQAKPQAERQSCIDQATRM
jgi:hypothetical protein